MSRETGAPTEKLYWQDPHATAFEAEVVEVTTSEDRPAVVLARTLFYPEGGGQLGDTGVLEIAGARLAVRDTLVDEAGRILHLVEAEGVSGIGPGALARGEIDPARRRDHMAQHTAQHALSRALADVASAATVSSRLGASTCTIDVVRGAIPDAELGRAEDLVDALVRSDVVVRALYPSPEELASLPLRKQPSVREGVRVIDIDGFDLTPCGGTHCTRTGQIGQVRIVATERYKGMLRITFHAGRRALLDARARHEALAAAAATLTCGALEVTSAVGKLRAELKVLRGRLESARFELADRVAAGLLATMPRGSAEPLVLPVLRAEDDLPALRALAGKLAEGGAQIVALVAGVDPETGELLLVAQRGASAPFDCGAFVLAESKARGGRGGGRPERAEGRFPKGTPVEALAGAARSRLPA